jgi:hypothetical protein
LSPDSGHIAALRRTAGPGHIQTFAQAKTPAHWPGLTAKFRNLLAEDVTRWTPVVKALGFRID